MVWEEPVCQVSTTVFQQCLPGPVALQLQSRPLWCGTEQVKYHTEEVRYHTEEVRYHAGEVRYCTEELRYHTEEVRYHTEEVRRHNEEVRYYTLARRPDAKQLGR